MKSFFADHPVILTSLRWILFIPAGIAAGIISAFIWRFFLTSNWAGNIGEVFYELRLTNGFAGNFFYGPVLIIAENTILAFCGMFASLYLVPKSRAVIGGLIIGIMFALSIFTFVSLGFQFEYLFPFEARIRFFLEWFGFFLGSFLAIKAISDWLKDYLKDGIFGIDEAIDASWHTIMMGDALAKISERQKREQLAKVKNSRIYTLLSSPSKKILEKELCSSSWTNEDYQRLNMFSLSKILEIEMLAEINSWHLEARRALGIDWQSMDGGDVKKKFEKFSESKKIKGIKFSLGELLNIFNKAGDLLDSQNHETNRFFRNRFSKRFIDYLTGDFKKFREPLRKFRNDIAHGRDDSKNKITMQQLVGAPSLSEYFENNDNFDSGGIFPIFLNRSTR